MLLLPNFQRSFRLFCRPILIGVAKVRAIFISAKFFCYFLKFYFQTNPEIFRRTCVFLKRIAKIRADTFTTNFFSIFYSHSYQQLHPDYQGTKPFFSKRAAKIGGCRLPANLFKINFTRLHSLRPVMPADTAFRKKNIFGPIITPA